MYRGMRLARWCADAPFDKNPISTAMRQCKSKQDVATFILQQDEAAIVDTHDLEAARLMANLDGPLLSSCGRALEVMNKRMNLRYRGTEGRSESNKLLDIVKGNTGANKKDGPRQKLSGSVGIYLEFAHWYATIYYNYANARTTKPDKANPVYTLSKGVVQEAVAMLCQRARKMGGKIDRPQHIPTAILSLGMLEMGSLWKTTLRPFVCEGRPYVRWVNGVQKDGITVGAWDPDQLANVIFGCIAMNLHSSSENRHLVETCLQRVASEEIMMIISGSTLATLLKQVATIKVSHGPMAEAVKMVFANAQRRITSLAIPELKAEILKSLPGEVEQSTDGNDAKETLHDLQVEDYEDTNFLIGSMTLKQLCDVVEAYNVIGNATPVHTAVASRIVVTQSLREKIELSPRFAAEVLRLFRESYSRPLFDVICSSFLRKSAWDSVRMIDLHRLLLILHETKHHSRHDVFDSAKKGYLFEILERGESSLSPTELSSLRNLLVKVGIDDPLLMYVFLSF
eukprot:TRINITY_DN20169_c0_g1_i3.p1 TRINITY_DN20169_c0_g1~~TRINITY_DN20169_c0_g1_i3.p1  ORF type:complete len:512 (+),score=101.12 TRINITY_DN20169_c0_g1_i3:163-1698(+)